MKTYYKGKLILKNNTYFNKVTIYFITHYDSIEIYSPDLDNNEKITLENYIYDNFHNLYDNQLIKDKKILDIINEFLELHSRSKIDILFEKIEDKDGKMYAKELHTGLVFPIVSCNHDMITKIEKIEELDLYSYKKRLIFKFDIVPRQNYDLIECYCEEKEIADINEVNKYLDKFKSGFRKKSNEKSFKEKIQSLYNKNVLNSEIQIEEKNTPTFESKNQENIVMENIEYLLSILKDNNQELFNKYNTDYEKLLNSNDCLTLTPINLASLVTLESSIELSMNLNKRNANNIVEYLDNLIEEYLTNFLTGNNKNTNITLEELDNINKFFLKSQQNYSIQTQRLILRKLAVVFLLEVKENINSITEKDLTNSYFSQNIKSILITVKSLIAENIISVNMPSDLINDLSISNILNVIRNTQFNTFDDEKANELVKKFIN